MLHEPTLDKLYAMRMAAMAIAWTEQNKDPNVGQLSHPTPLRQTTGSPSFRHTCRVMPPSTRIFWPVM